MKAGKLRLVTHTHLMSRSGRLLYSIKSQCLRISVYI